MSGTSTKREAQGPRGTEILLLLVTAPLAVVLGYVLWGVVVVEPQPAWLRIRGELWRAILLIWSGGIALVLAHGLQSYLGNVFKGREANLLYLQDELWTATRGEQRRIWRWLTWARLRQQRKKEEEEKR
jgi:hypothetical protein